MAAFQRSSVNQIGVHLFPTKKFKTVTLMLMLQEELRPNKVTRTALLPEVLKRGSRAYPSAQTLRHRLDDMFGAFFFADILKRGERHIVQFYLDVPNEAYLSAADSLLQESVRFLGEVAARPLQEDRGFRQEYLESAKESLRQTIGSLVDDKVRYAAERCVEAMCQGEPYGLLAYGKREELEQIEGRPLYENYLRMLQENPMDLFVVGDVEMERLEKWVKESFPLQRSTIKDLPDTQVVTTVGEVKYVVDEMEVTQGKLNLGLRTGVTYDDEDYPALMLYNGILGGFAHSKLFMNVREKASLAYYASSRIESLKGLLTIQSGIEVQNYDKALQIIQEQLDMMRQGDISEDELEQTKAVLSNQLKQTLDRASSIVDSHFLGLLGGRLRPLDEVMRLLQEVRKEDVQAVAQKVQLDTVYFLRDPSKGGTG